MNLNLPHEDDVTLEKIAKWLRDLAEGVENSNANAEHVATQAYRLLREPNDTVRNEVANAIEAAMDDVNDIDTTFSDFAEAAMQELFFTKVDHAI